MPIDSQPSIELAIEEWADKEFESFELPHAIKDVAIWHILTASEDWTRMLFTRHIEKPEQEIDATVDRLKYAIKVILTRISRKAKIDTIFPTPQKTIPAAYILATKLIIAGLEYSDMIRVFTSIHSGNSEIKKSDGYFEITYREDYDERYSALEVLNHGREPEYDITTLLYNNLSGRSPDNELATVITNGVRIRNGRVVYSYLPEGIFHILNRSQQRDLLIPNEFLFDWGTGHETHALINSLLTRCIYHLLSINFAAEKFNIRGGFDSSLILQTTREKLIEELSLLADLPKERIGKFIDTLTYGVNCESPDPALQPIIKMRNGGLLIPCSHTITSNTQRNILSLIARTQSSIFDSQSKAFELRMCSDLLEASGRWKNKAANRTFKADGFKEEIDLIIVDEDNRTILALEARWMLQPGDPREVLNRVDSCGKKVAQISRKISFLKKYIHQILENSLSISSANTNWQVLGAVVIEGFGGKHSMNQDLPIISINALKIGLGAFDNLANLHCWIKSLDWLPQPDVHFEKHINEIVTPFGTIKQPSILMLSDQQTYTDHIRLSAKNSSCLSSKDG